MLLESDDTKTLDDRRDTKRSAHAVTVSPVLAFMSRSSRIKGLSSATASMNGDKNVAIARWTASDGIESDATELVHDHIRPCPCA